MPRYVLLAHRYYFQENAFHTFASYFRGNAIVRFRDSLIRTDIHNKKFYYYPIYFVTSLYARLYVFDKACAHTWVLRALFCTRAGEVIDSTFSSEL